MPKQPKYFQSGIRLTRSQPVSQAPAPATLIQSATIEKHADEQTTSFRGRKIPLAILCLGLCTLLSLSALVLVNTGMVKPAVLQSKLPILFVRNLPINTVVAASGQSIGEGINFDIQTADARPEIIRSFLERYKSPLTPYDHYAHALVEAADRYDLDYRLLPAIMMQESNLCKNSDPTLHNCLGFGIHERGTLGFDTYEAGFDRAARELKANYVDQGLTTPELIMKKYTPGSNGSWADSVNQWIAEMEHNDREVGKTATADADLLEYSSPK